MELAGRYGKPHPLFSIAAIAVILASSVLVAAAFGWIPSARSERVDGTAAQAALETEVPTTGSSHDAPSGGRSVREPAPACGNCGVVEAVRAVEVAGEGTGLGAVAGGVAGAVVGSQLGKGNGRTALGVLGAVGGAFAGNAIERNSRAAKRYRVTVRMGDGSTRIVYSSARPNVAAGDKVRLLNGALVAQG